MKNGAGLVTSALLILVALFIAVRTTTQETSPRPEAALRLATALHQVATPFPPAPTPTSTPAPTVTPIPGWAKLTTVALDNLIPATELWLPASFVAGDLFFVDRQRTAAPIQPIAWTLAAVTLLSSNDANANRPPGNAVGMTVLFAADSLTDYDSSAKVRVVKLSPFFSEPFAYALDDSFVSMRLFDAVSYPQDGRYPVTRTEIAGIASSGIAIRKLLYWVDAGNSRWLIICTTRESDLRRNRPIFERSVQSFSVVPLQP